MAAIYLQPPGPCCMCGAVVQFRDYKRSIHICPYPSGCWSTYLYREEASGGQHDERRSEHERASG